MKAPYLNVLILVVVASGTVFASFIGDVSRGVEPLQTLFFSFVAAIITIQVLPALVMLGCLIRSLLVNPQKRLAAEKLDK